MVKARLTAVALLAAGLLSVAPAPRELPSEKSGPECDSGVQPEPEARANDRDGCHVNDFWSADLQGLYTLTSAANLDSSDPSIKLIELSVASFDEAPPSNEFRNRNVAGEYKVTSAGILMPWTAGALRVVEFAPAHEGERQQGAP